MRLSHAHVGSQFLAISPKDQQKKCNFIALGFWMRITGGAQAMNYSL